MEPAPKETSDAPQKTANKEPTTLEEALALIGELRADNERLRKLSKAEDEQTGRTPYSNRMLMKDILNRPDQGTGLIGRSVTVAGWVRTIRPGKGLFFLCLNDGTSHRNLQIIIDADVPGYEEMAASNAKTGASVLARGKIVESKGKGQKIEMLASKVSLIGGCDPLEYPLAKKEHTLEHLRSVGHLRARTQTMAAVMRVRNALAFATHTFFQERGFIYLHTPIITASDCEGAGEMFQVTTLFNSNKNKESNVLKPSDLPVVKETGNIDFQEDFFDRPAFLTVSGQLNGEQYACALSNIYTFGPTFRAEYSFTSRHLSEFWMIEPEMAFYDLDDNMDLAEAYLKFCIKYVLEHCPEEMEFLSKLDKEKPALLNRLTHVVETPFKRITYTEAIDKLIKSGKKFEETPVWGIDMGSEHERFLTEQVFKMPIIVTDYPKSFKAFYMRLNDDGKTVRAMDVLVPKIGEIIGGSQREERLDVLKEMIKEKGLDEASYSHYLDLRRFGTVPHSGFGLGFERLVLFATGMENIRDVIPFPRWPKHADF